MGFFDLNIPYLEGSAADKSFPDKAARKATRLKLCTKAMELGYTGIAYNRSIKGVMSDSDYCPISLTSLSSLLKLAPSLAASVKLHRDLIGVPISSPFRQYKRLTVSVESSAQASVLNSGNPILKTYDLVAVRPLSQNAFEQACRAAEVDIIAIDFSEKLPFRLKLPMVKAAIERGVYFEITYADLIADVQTRRQVISNAKLLVDWTRGKNLILSSAAPSVNELRGPYDVANLAFLLGLSMERAKAALSKNCRCLMAKALRKKQCYKEAIKVEVISSGEQSDSKEHSFGDWLKWDPVSSGEGDLLLDDMAKIFSASSKVSKTVKPIDFASLLDSGPSHGLQVKDLMPGTVAVSQPPDGSKNLLSAAEELDMLVATNRVSEQPDQLDFQPKRYQASLFGTPSKHQTSGCEDYRKSFLPSDSPIVLIGAEKLRSNRASTEGQSKNSDGVGIHFAPNETELHNLQCVSSCEAVVMLPDNTITMPTSPRDIEVDAACYADSKVDFPTPSRGGNLLAFQNEESEKSKVPHLDLGAQNAVMHEVLIDIDKNRIGLSLASHDVSLLKDALDTQQSREARDGAVLPNDGDKNQADLSLASHDVSLLEDPLDTEQSTEARDDAVVPTDGVLFVESYGEMKVIDDFSVANLEPPQEVSSTTINNPTSEENTSGKCRLKRRRPHQAFLFPFKRLLNPIPPKKKARTLKTTL